MFDSLKFHFGWRFRAAKVACLLKIAYWTPRSLLYFMVIQAWALATTEAYTNKTPDAVTWDMVCKHLEKAA